MLILLATRRPHKVTPTVVHGWAPPTSGKLHPAGRKADTTHCSSRTPLISKVSISVTSSTREENKNLSQK